MSRPILNLKKKKRTKKINPLIEGFVEFRCALDASAWHSYSELYEVFWETDSSASDVSRKQFIAALRSVPGFKAEARDNVCGMFGLQLVDRAPVDHEKAEAAFAMLGPSLEGKTFEIRDLVQLMSSNTEIADALKAAGCLRPHYNAAKFWVNANRDRILAGWKLVRVIKDGTYFRHWEFVDRRGDAP
jgi:hypothetical protein